KHPPRRDHDLDPGVLRAPEGAHALLGQRQVGLKQGVVEIDRDHLGAAPRARLTVQTSSEQLRRAHSLLTTTMERIALTKPRRIDAHTADQKPCTVKPGTRPLVKSSMRPLMTNVKSPRVTMLMGSVSRKRT